MSQSGLQKKLPASQGASGFHDPLPIVDALRLKLLAGQHHDDLHLAADSAREHDPSGDEEDDGRDDAGGPRAKGLAEQKATDTDKSRKDKGKHAARLTPKGQLDPSPIQA